MNLNRLKYWLTADTQDIFNSYGVRDRRYTYIDNNSPILAVAHLDTVNARRINKITKKAIASTSLDDRLGAYVIMEELPKLGINVDVLLTTDEEVCNSSAMDFIPDKDYNWMFSFDRAGKDVVVYQYDENLDWLIELEKDFTIGIGSYSCIAELESLEVCGVNIGVGYYQNHSPSSFSIIKHTEEMVMKFKKFYNRNKGNIFIHEPTQVFDDEKRFDEEDWKRWKDYWDEDDFSLNDKEYGSKESVYLNHDQQAVQDWFRKEKEGLDKWK